MDGALQYFIRFDGLEEGDAGRAAERLRMSLLDLDPTIQAERARTDAEAMDFGAVLAVTLAAPSVIALAKGIADWLARTHSSKVTVKKADGTTIVENIGHREAVELAEKLQAAYDKCRQ